MPDPEVTTYTAVLERAGPRMWLVELVEEPRVRSYGHTLRRARANILDQTAIWFDVTKPEINLVYDVRLPGAVRNVVTRARRSREYAVAAQQEAADATRSAALALVGDAHLSVRDAATVLGLSHQRVQQLVFEPRPEDPPRAEKPAGRQVPAPG